MAEEATLGLHVRYYEQCYRCGYREDVSPESAEKWEPKSCPVCSSSGIWKSGPPKPDTTRVR